mmetsp:Transcript_45298/g.101976  ORF Transcript_45298/g.101976 Transcript_45298/m.101976 type:complete len:620 (-) Transcript_45298:96-1955(-)
MRPPCMKSAEAFVEWQRERRHEFLDALHRSQEDWENKRLPIIESLQEQQAELQENIQAMVGMWTDQSGDVQQLAEAARDLRVSLMASMKSPPEDNARHARSVSDVEDMSPTRGSPPGGQGSLLEAADLDPDSSLSCPSDMHASQRAHATEAQRADPEPHLEDGGSKAAEQDSGRQRCIWDFLFPEADSALQTPLGRLVSHQTFERICLMVICIHVAFMGFAAQNEAEDVYSRANVDVAIVEVFDRVFLVFYSIELGMKLLVHRCSFFVNEEWKWNIFDLMCVLPIYSVLSAGQSNASFARVLRILKMTRLFRVFRLMRFFNELRMFLYLIVRGMPTLFWTLVMICSINFIFGIAFVQGVESYLTTPTSYDPERDEKLRTYWGGVIKAMVTLFMAITGGYDWKEVGNPLRAVGPMYHSIFIFYIVFVILGVLNILIGMFSESAQEASTQDVGSAVQMSEDLQASFDEGMTNLFKMLDVDGSGDMTLEEFEEQKDDEIVRAYLRVLGIEVANAELLFKTLAGEDGVVDLEEFVTGCAAVKGVAGRRQLHSAGTFMRAYMKQTRCFMGYVEEALTGIHQHVLQEGYHSASKLEPLQSRLETAKVPLVPLGSLVIPNSVASQD